MGSCSDLWSYVTCFYLHGHHKLGYQLQQEKNENKGFFPSLHVRGIILVASIASECDLRF